MRESVTMQSRENVSGFVKESINHFNMMGSNSKNPRSSHYADNVHSDHHRGFFPPMQSPTGDKFKSSFSIIMLAIFFIMLRSSASPFLNPSGEPRKAASSSFYFNLSCILYFWVISSALLTIIPNFSSHYNGVISAALFFPMMFSSIAALLCGRLFVRSTFYCLIRGGIYTSNKKEDLLDGTEKRGIKGIIKRKPPQMTAFHRPFRKLAKSAAVLSVILALLHAHCWSRTLSVFKINKDDGAGAICRAVFSPLASKKEGADEQCIWIIWGTAIMSMLMVFAQDELNGLHCRSKNSGFSMRHQGSKKRGRAKRSATDEVVDYDRSPERHGDSFHTLGSFRKRFFFRGKRNSEVPKDTLPMVPWLSLFAAHSMIDIFLQLKVFLGRVDARLMQPALREQSKSVPAKEPKIRTDDDPADAIGRLREEYPGCVYDYSSRGLTKNGGFWFDFMADCGDGFDSSYQVARLLAQQKITAVKKGKELKLPRGEILVLGGDLAYPEPTEHSYEKRFFRTFEDAMSPPPSFRRTKIATNKHKICVKGWNEEECFENDSTGSTEKSGDMHLCYKGPSSFIVPGNHDWYDGLATYSRFILSRDFLGGWFMPQQRSYFVIKLVSGWWIFGLDCGLSADIDVEQFKFFANVADTAVGASDSVIVINHEPHWVTDYDNGKKGDNMSERNMNELMEAHLRGKVRARLAGDLHHYTRHTHSHTTSSKKSQRRTRSLSLDRLPPRESNGSNKRSSGPKQMKPFTEENRPELIVSGGGGAFLHGTNTFDRDIKVGPKQQDYTRVVAYPNEAISSCLGWLNMYQFRWRGWRCDLIFAVLYLSIVSSLFPLCGIYDDYEEFNPDHEILLFLAWLARTIGSLIIRVVSCETFSLFSFIGFLVIALALQCPEHHMKPTQRYFLVICHAIGHITAALTCLIFLQCVAEWLVKEQIVKVTTGTRNPFATPHTGIAGSIYDEYKTHVYPVLKNFTHAGSTAVLVGPFNTELMTSTASKIKTVMEYGSNAWDFLFTHVPLLKTTLKIFDLPSLVAQNHHDMCSHLCVDGMECLMSHDPIRFQTIKRGTFVPYLVGITLYYVFIAVPMAGNIFGTWLAVSLNIFKCQCDLAFSSLQIKHYKNFLKLHIKEDGELEVFAIGLQKVPTAWVKDPAYEEMESKFEGRPSWSWKYPSKWIPAKRSKYHTPQIVDYVCIPKRRIKQA